jgi:4-hydroxy-tetrahydrodipicolinate reductase
MKIGICGIGGRMGLNILEQLKERGHTLTSAIDSPESPYFGGDISGVPGTALSGLPVISPDQLQGGETQVVIDFSAPAAAMILLERAAAAGTALVIGTTGFTPEQRERISLYSEKMPIVFSPNMSVGVNILFKLTAMAAKALQGYDVEIFEAHHHHKKDAPSGTAVRLIDIIKESSAELAAAEEVHGRSGITGERGKREIGVHAMRGGDIVGEHTVFFADTGERIELTHRSTSRKIFARGAVIAAEYLNGKKAGLYTMFDVLGLNDE